MPRASSVAIGFVFVLVCSAIVLGVHPLQTRARGPAPSRSAPSSSVLAAPLPASAPVAVPAHVEVVSVAGDLPAFVIRASGVTNVHASMVFIPGMCVHPGGYVEAFQVAAASRGDLVTLQGDVSCGGDGFARKWSGDLEAMNRRIEAAFVASGLGAPHDLVVIGYSQGAERAERLVARWPDRFASAILIASPITPAPQDFAHAHGVVFASGTLDAQEPMRGAVPRFRRAGIPATFVSLPGARHGQMGTKPEESMAEALDFLRENQRM